MADTEDVRAKEIVAARDRARSDQALFLDLWQQTADLMFPRENQINTLSPGEDKSLKRYDDTAIRDSEDMASGLSAALVPTGQKFFSLKAKDRRVAELDVVERYLLEATEIAHDEMYESNFMLELNETLRSLVVFGTGNLYSEWEPDAGGLNYRDYDVSLYQIRENSRGTVDTVFLTLTLTARQAIQELGEDNATEAIRAAAQDPNKENDKFEFVHVVRPRADRNPAMRDNRNMSWESVIVDVKGKTVVQEKGYEEMPFAVARWMKTSSELYGRGQGTDCLADVKTLQVMMRDFIDLGNRFARPPLEVLQDYDGLVNISPGAINRVPQLGSIKGIDQTVLGNPPITKDMIELKQEMIHKAFFRDVFVQLTDLKGDRRTTVEIMERLREGLRRLASPVARLQSELLGPVITRSVLLLIRNGRIPRPPAELAGQNFGIEYEGQLALALRDQQAKGFVQFASLLRELVPIFPEAMDVLNMDEALSDMARSYGVKLEHIASDEQIAQKREARARALGEQRAEQSALAQAEAYKKTTAAPEPGSPAEELVGARR